MTGTEARGYLLDTTALTALPSSRRVSIFVTTAPHFHLPLYAPVTCVDAADRMRPGIARHVGRVPTVEPVDLTHSAVLDLRERTPHMALDIAHVVSLAREPRLVRRADRGHRPAGCMPISTFRSTVPRNVSRRFMESPPRGGDLNS